MDNKNKHDTPVRDERSNHPLAKRFLAEAIAAGDPCVATMAHSMRLANLFVLAMKNILIENKYLCLRGLGTLRVHEPTHSRRKISITTAWPMLDRLNLNNPKRKQAGPGLDRFNELLHEGKKKLFMGHLSPDAERSFQAQGALKALERIAMEDSSTALTLNIFDHWFDTPGGPAPLIEALELGNSYSNYLVEATYEKPLPALAAHYAPTRLDLYLGTALFAAGVESKHTEWRHPKNFSISKFETTYTNRKKNLELALPASLELAEEIRRGDVKFRHLDASQLLSQAAGLQVMANRSGTSPVLLYLYFDEPGSQASKEHARELLEFEKRIEPAIPFIALTYQTLFSRLEKITAHDDHHKYLTFLRLRYFRNS